VVNPGKLRQSDPTKMRLSPFVCAPPELADHVQYGLAVASPKAFGSVSALADTLIKGSEALTIL
jgi:hypothetical protein